MAENRHACDRRNLADSSCLQFRGVRRAARGLQGNVRVTVREFLCGRSWRLCWSVAKLFPRSGCSWSFRAWRALSRESCTERELSPYSVRGVADTKLRVSLASQAGSNVGFVIRSKEKTMHIIWWIIVGSSQAGSPERS